MNILIYGSRDFGQIIKELVICIGHNFMGFIDDFNSGDEIIGSYEKSKEKFLPKDAAIIIGIGYQHLAARWKLYQNILRDGYHIPTLIHPEAYVSNPDAIGQGTIIMARAIIDVKTKIDSLVTIWPGSIVNHDVTIGANTFLSPGSIVCGFSEIGAHSFVGAGAIIADHCIVPPESFVKAGKIYHAV
ncbi:MAG TPA: hypothetical protein VLI69_00705 [Gammaproteobacteria bacterium]|nr:hypothetical protein [Gammaproteobacteria bacterium]